MSDRTTSLRVRAASLRRIERSGVRLSIAAGQHRAYADPRRRVVQTMWGSAKR